MTQNVPAPPEGMSVEKGVSYIESMDPHTGRLKADVTFSDGRKREVHLGEHMSHYYHIGLLASGASRIESFEALMFQAFEHGAYPSRVEHLEYVNNPFNYKTNRKALCTSLAVFAPDILVDYEAAIVEINNFMKVRNGLVHGLVVIIEGKVSSANANRGKKVEKIKNYDEILSLEAQAMEICISLRSLAERILFVRKKITIIQDLSKSTVPVLLPSSAALDELVKKQVGYWVDDTFVGNGFDHTRYRDKRRSDVTRAYLKKRRVVENARRLRS